jgi:hypothetical protein
VPNAAYDSTTHEFGFQTSLESGHDIDAKSMCRR